MIYTRFCMKLDTVPQFGSDAEERSFLLNLGLASEEFVPKSEQSKKDGKDGKFFLYCMKGSEARGCAIAPYRVNKEQCAEFLDFAGLSASEITLEEICVDVVSNILRRASRTHFVDENFSDYIMEEMNIACLARTVGRMYKETIIPLQSEDDILDEAQFAMAQNTFFPEYRRIAAGCAGRRFHGHPAQYFVISDSEKNRESICEALLSALFLHGRLLSARSCTVRLDSSCKHSPGGYESLVKDLYQNSVGGSVVVCFDEEPDDSDRALFENSFVETVCACAKKYKNDVQSVFCFADGSVKLKKTAMENLFGLTVVELAEEKLMDDRAREYLTKLAAGNGLTAEDALYAELEENRSYHATELRALFDRWYDKMLRIESYPQYSSLDTVRERTLTVEENGNAYDELLGLIGLGGAKSVIEKALASYRINKIRAEIGMPCERPSLHMVFTGNPGSAKTTVARLFARILRDNKVLPIGHLVEVGRSELVGKYVGWTAKIVKEKFELAKGGVLFIDEAYSLADKSGSFGDEAINTIVQEMENHRDEVVVILAGYPDKMEQFLKTNPGLRSRFAFHVPFEDYSTHELCEIASLMAKKKGLCFEEGVMPILEETFEEARRQSDFGNGRYVRNLLEKAEMNCSLRLNRIDAAKITEEDLRTIRRSDFEIPKRTEVIRKRQIGFAG